MVKMVKMDNWPKKFYNFDILEWIYKKFEKLHMIKIGKNDRMVEMVKSPKI